MIRNAPVENTVITLVPLLAGLFQIANSVVTDLSFAVSVPFALVMVVFAAMLTQYNAAQFRRQRLEQEWIRLS